MIFFPNTNWRCWCSNRLTIDQLVPGKTWTISKLQCSTSLIGDVSIYFLVLHMYVPLGHTSSCESWVIQILNTLYYIVGRTQRIRLVIFNQFSCILYWYGINCVYFCRCVFHCMFISKLLPIGNIMEFKWCWYHNYLNVKQSISFRIFLYSFT